MGLPRAILAWAAMAAIVLTVLQGCGDATPGPSGTAAAAGSTASAPEPPATPTSGPTATAAAGSTTSRPNPAPTPEPVATPVAVESTPTVATPDSPPEPVRFHVMDAGPEFIGFTSLEERIFHSDVIIRARLNSISGKAKHTDRSSDDGHWIPVVVYEFEVLEYLKGQGTESLSINSSFGASGDSWSSSYEVYETEGDAIAAALFHISERDGKWDDREAILFVRQDPYWGNEEYGFTLSGSIQAPEYRIESRFNRVWLPAADVTSGAPEVFLMTAPPAPPSQEAQPEVDLEEIRRQLAAQLGSDDSPQLDEIMRGIAEQHGLTYTPPNSASSTAPWLGARESITLEELRQTIDDLDNSISRAQAEGITGYSECLESKYERERRNQQAIYEGGALIRHWWQHYAPPPPVRKVLFSGLPAEETILGEVFVRTTSRFGPDFKDKLWLDGPDAHLFRLHPDDDADANEDYISHTIVPSEVLPPGSYQFDLHVHPAYFQVCGYYDELSATGYFVEVIAPGQPGPPDARYASCVMDDVGVLAADDRREGPSFRIDPSSECGSTQTEDGRSHYVVFELPERVDVDVRLSYVCPSLYMFVHEGVGPQVNPIRSVGTTELLRDGVRYPAELGVLSPGRYTMELNVTLPRECHSWIYFSSYRE